MILNYDPAWTAEEAFAESEKERAADPSRPSPTLPFFRWAAHHVLATMQDEYQRGDKMALFAAIRECANHDMPLPEWASRAFIRGYDKVLNCHAKSWDDVFGRPYPKGVHLAALRRRRKLRFRVFKCVEDHIMRGPAGTPIDSGLFESVGDQLGIRKTLAEELYYEAVRIIGYSAKGKRAACAKNQFPGLAF